MKRHNEVGLVSLSHNDSKMNPQIRSAKLAAIMGLIVAACSSTWVSATLINFDDQGLAGPSVFASAGPAQTLSIPTVDGVVTFQGGVILDNTTYFPANQTALYGTAHFGSSLSNTLTVTFANPIQNFFLDVYNGETFNVNYTVSDNVGNSSSFLLAPNLRSGHSQVGFAATGNVVTITSDAGAHWDFFIDNIQFNAPLPGTSSVPDSGSSIAILGLALTGIAGLRRKFSV